MLIKLKDNDGRVIQEVEVDDAFGEWYIEEERKQENAERRHRYWVTVSMDSLEYEGEWFADPSPTPAEQYELDESARRVAEFKKTLTPVQLRRLEMLEEGMSEREIASVEGTNVRAIHDSKEQIVKKYKKFFKDTQQND